LEAVERREGAAQQRPEVSPQGPREQPVVLPPPEYRAPQEVSPRERQARPEQQAV